MSDFLYECVFAITNSEPSFQHDRFSLIDGKSHTGEKAFMSLCCDKDHTRVAATHFLLVLFKDWNSLEAYAETNANFAGNTFNEDMISPAEISAIYKSNDSYTGIMVLQCRTGTEITLYSHIEDVKFINAKKSLIIGLKFLTNE